MGCQFLSGWLDTYHGNVGDVGVYDMWEENKMKTEILKQRT